MINSSIRNNTLEYAKETEIIVQNHIDDYCASKLEGQTSILNICKVGAYDIGLRVRPFLLRMSSCQGDIDFDKIISISAGVEMIQLSTLILDDILDESYLRNNEPSLISEYGLKTGLSIGTIMSSLGFCMISEGINNNEEIKNGINLVRLFSQTHAEIYVGQYLDLLFEGDLTVSEEQYLDMITKTTGGFIQSSLVAGAMLWDATSEVIKKLERAGLFLGLAYQIRDDVIDIIGDSDYTGKPEGGDILRRKMRLPLIQGLRKSSDNRLHNLLGILNKTSLSDEDTSEIISLIVESGSIDYCISKVKEYCEKAIGAIEMLSEDFEDLKKHFCVVTGWISSFEDNV